MKKIFVICALFICVAAVVPASAQVAVGVNISSQPLWGPVGYDYVEYYYLPELGVYYYVPRHEFIYFANGRWIFVKSLPPAYGPYDLYTTYKVVINEPKPYLRHNVYVVKYPRTYTGPREVVIRDSNDPKYFVVKGHPRNAEASKQIKAKNEKAVSAKKNHVREKKRKANQQ